MVNAYREWEIAVGRALAPRYAAPAASDLALRAAAALGRVGLRVSIEDWTALPREQADRFALLHAIDGAFGGSSRQPPRSTGSSNKGFVT